MGGIEGVFKVIIDEHKSSLSVTLQFPTRPPEDQHENTAVPKLPEPQKQLEKGEKAYSLEK